MSPPKHGLWTHSPAASDFCLWIDGGSQPPAVGRGVHSPVRRPNRKSLHPRRRRVFTKSAPRIPSLKLGRKWGRGGGGDKGAGCSALLNFGLRLLPRLPAARPEAPDPRVLGEGAGNAPGLRCARGTGVARMPRSLRSGRSPAIHAALRK